MSKTSKNTEFCYIIKKNCIHEYLDCASCSIYHKNRHEIHSKSSYAKYYASKVIKKM